MFNSGLEFYCKTNFQNEIFTIISQKSKKMSLISFCRSQAYRNDLFKLQFGEKSTYKPIETFER